MALRDCDSSGEFGCHGGGRCGRPGQAKRQRKTVGIKAVQEVGAAREYYNANVARVITTSEKFSRNAVELANKMYIELWDRNHLKNELKLYNYKY